MRKTSRQLALVLALVMVFTWMVTPIASATKFVTGENDEQNPKFTQEMLDKIEQNNQKINDYMKGRNESRVLDRRLLDITPIVQENDSYCGPACAKMAADYLGLKDQSGQFFTQKSIAPIINCDRDKGTYSGDIAIGMNKLIGSDIYELTQTDKSDLVASFTYGINNGYPMFINIKKLPNYSDPVSSGHFILGVGYAIYTQGGNTQVSNIVYNDPRPGYGAQYTITSSEMVTACNSKAGNFVRAVP